MNPILELRGQFKSRSNQVRGGGFKFPKGKSLNIGHLKDLAKQLRDVYKRWQNDTSIEGALVSVYYHQIVAKSNRIKQLLSYGKIASQDSVCGAKFTDDRTAHIFTHYVSLEALSQTANDLDAVTALFESKYVNEIDADNAEQKINDVTAGDLGSLTRTKVKDILHDAVYVSCFKVDESHLLVRDDAIVTIYKTGVETKRLLSLYDIVITDDRIINETTLQLHVDELRKLLDRAPYLVSMQLADMREIPSEDVEEKNDAVEQLIPLPSDEPTIGVIDTQFNKSVYFSNWVEYHNMLSPDIEIYPEDCWHGTAVDSIIVDGPRGNPHLEDYCGNFRVRHFGVATKAGFSSFEILKKIRRIIEENRDIHVWNLSLGSALEISQNFISPEGAVLDDLQRKYDVIFVVAGTNVPNGKHSSKMRIGAPADSLNSVVVNAVGFDDRPASYTRTGPVLSFFNKPDVCYYGGDGASQKERMVVCRGLGASYVAGTSYAAPWIARKLAYMIEILGLNRELAKALLIDAAAGWNLPTDTIRMGYGIVPISINDIVKSKDDEIRFVMTAFTEKYETYTYQLPVPVVANAYPYHARVTLTYFPYCDQRQGVDYTGTEMDVHFGRVKVDGNKIAIHAIDGNKQGDEGPQNITEDNARANYRKWDNVKHVVERISDRSRPRQIIGPSKFWGLSIKSKERKSDGSKDKIPFGVVVTLREMNGKNRIEDFIRMCEAYGWIVNRIDIQNRLDVYATAEQEIELE